MGMGGQLPAADTELLALYVSVLDELKARGITRTNNLPTGDYAERLVCDALGGTLEPNSQKGWDLVTNDGVRVQVKARRCNPAGSHGGFGALRSLLEDTYDTRKFDALVAVIFDYHYVVQQAWWIPWQAVKDHAGYSSTWKAARLGQITEAIISADGVRALTLDQTSSRDSDLPSAVPNYPVSRATGEPAS